MFVIVTSGELSGLGIARLLSRSSSTATIEFFAGPDQDVQPKYTVPIDLIRPAPIPRETRIFSPQTKSQLWRVGRCMDGTDDPIQVQFPNQEAVNIPADEVFVRWRRPIERPECYLARFITETPRFAHARQRFVGSLVAQRATAMGITAALSSAIELEPHQLEVARRVLHDPIQRYLLADEVGLGKTIEACIVIRQFFIDRPYDANAMVLVPPSLVSQWTEELATRFSLEAELGSGLHVISSESLDEIAALLPDVELLVVDEAHHLTSDSAEATGLYEVVRLRSATLPRLLLLSATPVLGNEGEFHKLLHLLDPVTYPLNDVAAFKERIDNRQEIAEAVAALVPENALVLEPFLDQLSATFSTDALLLSAVEALRRILERFPNPDDPELVAALKTLRSHVTDTYRLDRRILRNRRSQLPFLTPTRGGSKVWSYLDDSRAALSKAVEELRRSFDAVVRAPDQDDLLRDVSVSLIAHSLAGPLAILDWVAGLPGNLKSILERDLTVISALAEEASSSTKRQECLYKNLSHLTDQRVKALVFCTSPAVADDLYQYLRVRMAGNVERHGRFPRRGEPGWERFLQKGTCQVLVCDESAEEGLNLQGGSKILVHYDLPLAPNRIEQRIGRLDRYGSGSNIDSYVIVCDADPIESEWYRCLANGFEVFSRSIASLQYLVGEAMRELHAALSQRGAEGFDFLTEALGGPAGRINAEFKRIAAQDALDALSIESDDSWDRMGTLDADWKGIRDACEPWIHQTLGFGREEIPQSERSNAGDRTSRYRFSNSGRHPTLVSVTEFAPRFASTMDRSAPDFKPTSPVTYPYSFRRKSALSADAREHHVRLLRAGDVFVDGLEEFTRLDDRGRIYAFWRNAKDYVSASTTNVDVYFCVHVVIQADVRPAVDAMAGTVAERSLFSAPLLRRADAILPPMDNVIWLDSAHRVVDGSFVDRWLRPEYNKDDNTLGGRDTNLRTDRWDAVRARGIPEMERWQEMPLRVADEALKRSMENPRTQKIIAQASGAAREAWARRGAQLLSRLANLKDTARTQEELAAVRERGVNLALIRGISAPIGHVDSIGAVFISPDDLSIVSEPAR
jgi:ATP-dependent helicase HepA